MENNNVDLKLKKFVENIEHLEIEKKEKNEEISAVYKEAKMAGFDIKIIKKIIALRKKEINERIEEENLLEAYKEALGMVE